MDKLGLGARASLTQLRQTHWDLVVIGGGITGAGVLLEAAKLAGAGKKVLLLEQKDFAWGSSSRSSKMVHGGIRYMAQADFALVRESLHERERLLRELPELVQRQPYLFVMRRANAPNRWLMGFGLWLYDVFAGIRDHRWLPREQLQARLPTLGTDGLKGAMYYTDALVDDTRLVLRVLHEAVRTGAQLCNYMQVRGIARTADAGFALTVQDGSTQEVAQIQTRAVINATGALADDLSGVEKKVRPLRGSHILIPHERLPMSESVAVLNRADNRYMFIYPWMGMTCIGTTDLDHREDLHTEAHCTRAELNYLLNLVNAEFPQARINEQDVVSTFAGVRPIIASGKGVNPSQERRSHSVWSHNGVVTVSGGKLTTFRVIAHDALHAAGWMSAEQVRELRDTSERLFQHEVAFPHELGHPKKPLPEGVALLECIEWVLRHELVQHLDDVLLRRVRIGNTHAQGAAALMPQIKTLCQRHLGWDEVRWADELMRYNHIIAQFYALPE